MTGRQQLIKDLLGLKAADKTMESGAQDELMELFGALYQIIFSLKDFFSIHVIKRL